MWAALWLFAVIPSHVLSAADAGPEVLPPWIVAEAPLRPDATPVRASALLPGDAWAGRAVGTLADAFRHIPGAILQESFGGFEPPRISIRGSGIQSAPSSRGVTLLLNQLPFGLADGSFNSALLDPLLGERVDVQRGLDGWRASPAVAGGALDFRRSPGADASAALALEGGSFGAARVRGIGSLARENVSATAALSYARQDGYREHSGQERTAFLGVLDRAAGAGARTTLELYHAHARYEVPGPLTLAAVTAAPRSVSADVRRDRPGRISGISRISGAFVRHTPDWEFEAGTAFARTDDDFRQLRANGVTDSRSDDLHVRAMLARRFSVGARPHQLRFAATASRGWRDQRRFLNDSGRRGAAFAHDGLFPRTIAVQLEDTFAVAPGLVGTLGIARVDARRKIDHRSGGGPASGASLASGATLPAASLRWRFAPENVVFISVSSIAEPPTFDDLLVTTGAYPSLARRSQHLDTQRAVTWEIGMRGRRGPVTWDAAMYHARWRNEILRLADAQGGALGAVNAGPTTHDGIEMSARWLVRDGPVRVSLVGAAVWTGFVFDDDPVYGRNRLAGLPPHFGSAEVAVEFPRGAFLANGANWTAGATRVDHAGRLRYGGQARAHVRAGWRDTRRWTCFVEIQNVLDRATIASTAGVLDLARNPPAASIFLPAPGRAFVVGIEWRGFAPRSKPGP